MDPKSYPKPPIPLSPKTNDDYSPNSAYPKTPMPLTSIAKDAYSPNSLNSSPRMANGTFTTNSSQPNLETIQKWAENQARTSIIEQMNYDNTRLRLLREKEMAELALNDPLRFHMIKMGLDGSKDPTELLKTLTPEQFVNLKSTNRTGFDPLSFREPEDGKVVSEHFVFTKAIIVEL